MKTPPPYRAGKNGRIKKIFLLFLLLAATLVVFLDLRWSYRQFEAGLGAGLAQTAIAYHVLLLLGMVAAGVGLGLWLDRMMRQGRSMFRSPRKGGWTEVFMNLWGHEVEDEAETMQEVNPPHPSSPDEGLVLLDLPTRRGRKPTFPLDRWLPLAAQWENRDPIRDAFTLGELICEHLGTNSDGSPIVSEQTYYSTWRPRAIAELHRRANSKKSSGVREADKNR